MPYLILFGWFMAGVFAANAIPHLVAGLMGRAFQSPFASPPGKGLSSSRTNVLWGFANVAVAWLLLSQAGQFQWRQPLHAGAVMLGAVLISLRLASHFGALHGGNEPGRK
ncbi:MAG: hypothetical protein R3F41_17505 [Gammaproteobacteria bacterium]|nr:hypothetical protein [Pseudomonadales bacterium]MCP5347347.1 hypothetical protein [Pseudomonadales bacterium]